jgi:hypothetical protein
MRMVSLRFNPDGGGRWGPWAAAAGPEMHSWKWGAAAKGRHFSYILPKLAVFYQQLQVKYRKSAKPWQQHA